jgi:hypothetical protein
MGINQFTIYTPEEFVDKFLKLRSDNKVAQFEND